LWKSGRSRLAIFCSHFFVLPPLHSLCIYRLLFLYIHYYICSA
jgi:hypothetical protein